MASSSTTKPKAVLGIDNGTQGLTVLLVGIDDPSLPVLATGEATYEFVPDLPEGCYEQRAADWEAAMSSSLDQIRNEMQRYEIVAIGVAGQMHGQVLVDKNGASVGTVRLWCDARNQEEANELSEWLGMNSNTNTNTNTNTTAPSLPKRMTVARWLWTVKHQPELARQTDFMTTPAGWLTFRLTNKSKTLGIGDASGMFPMDATTGDYRKDFMEIVDSKLKDAYPDMPPVSKLLPKVVPCGQDAGVVSKEAAERWGLPVGIPVAAAEGDQPAALVGSLIGNAGMVSCSFGTSVCANLVGSAQDVNIQSPIVNHFSAVNGQPIYMVWLRNGTTFFNSMVQSYGGNFDEIMPQVLDAPYDCGGLLSLPFMDDEPGLEVHQGGTALTIGWNPSNTQDAGNACKAALLSTMFNLLQGTQFLQSRNIPMTEILLSGGLTRTPECGQIVADVFGLPVRLLEGAEEGCSWGAAVLAKYRYEQAATNSTTSGSTVSDPDDWPLFLQSIPARPTRVFEPNADAVPVYQSVHQRYQKLLALQSSLQEAVSTEA
jgi:sugar (pentulose or hexulose) kinase